ncbi:hypothetical protein [Parabacteroides sp. AM08-6]|uniref:Kelch repeat-containing protein n=1 Tax=Parabacteroides sp. AM08-6 TaxID=2292053 RepID=UPI000EFDD04E|nr:hypothetical protein [Parabacteroides sp. AM08-6]RHJ87838.1 hypothetical protein DW103_01325 [Parabacteroides sp. AM08-6]
MKHLYLILSVFIFLNVLSGCVDDPDMDTKLQNAKAPEVSETENIKVTASSIEVRASIIKENGSPIVECGICWSEDKDTDPKDNLRNNRKVKAEKTENGVFTATISNLDDETNYYVYAYAINKTDTAYSATVMNYKTINGVGEVKIMEPDSIHATSVFLCGKITSRGEGTIKKVGFYLSDEEGNRELSDKDSTILYNVPGVDINKIDSFTWHVTDLKPETKYYVRAFAENDFGEFAFNIDSFITLDGKPKVGAIKVDSTNYTSAFLSAILESEGDAEVTSYGFCWSTSDKPEIGQAGTDTIVSVEMTDGKFIGTIHDLENSKKYFARAYVTNKFGTTYSESTNFSTLNKTPNILTSPIDKALILKGSAVVGGELQNGGETEAVEWGIYWSTDKKDLKQHKEVATDSLFTFTLSKLKGATTHYVYAYAKNQSGWTGYGDTLSFTTPDIFTNKNVYSSPRGFSAAFTMDNQAYIVGGDMGNKQTDELLSYVPERNEWVTLSPYKEGAFSDMTACTDANNQIFVIGGTDKQNAVTFFSSYNIDGNSWTSLPAVDNGRFDAISFAYKDSIYFIGGQDYRGSSDEISIFDKTNNEWKTSSAKFPVAQRKGLAVVVNDSVYAGLGEANQRGFWLATDTLTHWDSIDIPANIGVVTSGAYNEQRNSIFMIDDNSKIWEFKLENQEWIGHSVLKNSMKNYHIFILDGTIYILAQHIYNPNQFVTYDPDWDN